MGVSKSGLFTESHNKIADMAKALAHPARIAIIEYLLKAKSCICGDIVNELPLAQPTVSQHLKELKNAGFIKGTVEGTAICYCLDKDAIVMLRDYFDAISKQLTTQAEDCC